MVATVLDSKLANGGADGSAHVDAVYTIGGGVEAVKREPEDLTRRPTSPPHHVVVDRRRMVLLPHPTIEGSSARLDQATKDELEAQIKEEGGDRPRAVPQQATFAIVSPQGIETGDKMSTTQYLGFAANSPQPSYEHATYLSPSPQSYTTSAASPAIRANTVSYSAPDQYYDYYRTTEPQHNLVRPEYTTTTDAFDRYTRPVSNYKSLNLTVDSSPDSGTSSDPGRDPSLFNTQVRYLSRH